MDSTNKLTAILFPKDKFSPESIDKWLKDNGLTKMNPIVEEKNRYLVKVYPLLKGNHLTSYQSSEGIFFYMQQLADAEMKGHY